MNSIQKEYANVIFLDYIRTGSGELEKYFPPYLKEELGIGNIRMALRSFLRAGYIAENDGRYQLQEKGEQFLSDKTDYIKYFRLASLYVTLEEYLAAKKEHQEQTFEQCMTDLLQKKAEELKAEKQLSKARSAYLDIAALSEADGRCTDALRAYLQVLYYNAAGVEYSDLLQKYRNGKYSREKARKLYDYIYFTPEALRGIARLRDAFDAGMIRELFSKNKLQFGMCSEEKFAELAASVMDESFSEEDWQKYFSEVFDRMLAANETKQNK